MTNKHQAINKENIQELKEYNWQTIQYTRLVSTSVTMISMSSEFFGDFRIFER